MSNLIKIYSIFSSVLLFAFVSPVYSSGPLGVNLGVSVPFGDGSIVGFAAAGVIGIVWLARKIR